jgi:hypothetical protein
VNSGKQVTDNRNISAFVLIGTRTTGENETLEADDLNDDGESKEILQQ